MPSAATVTSVIAIAACIVGGIVAVGLWRQRAGAARARRLRHPATPPPVAVAVDDESGVRRWRLDVAEDAPPTAIDIVSWQARDGSQRWRSEPIVEPIEILPGGWALTPGKLPVADAYDVVIAWTSHTTAGELEGSRTFTVSGHPTPRVGAAPQRVTRSPLRWPLVEAVMLLALVAAGAFVVITWGGDGRQAVTDGTATPTASIPPAPTLASTAVPPSTIAAATTVTATGTAPPTSTLAPATTAVPTTRPIATSSTATSSTATPSAPSTSSTSTPPTSAPSTTGARVAVAASIDQCRAGPNCLVASFTIDGFDSPQSEYVCEFADGERITFSFGGSSVERACATGSADASITVEVGGVRSATITRADAN